MPHHAPPHLTMPTITHHTQERFGPVRRENLLNRSHTIHHIHFFRTPVQYAHTYVRMYVSIPTVCRYENSTSMGNQCNTSLKFDQNRRFDCTQHLLSFHSQIPWMYMPPNLSARRQVSLSSSIHVIVCVRLFELPSLDRVDHEDH